MTVVDRLKKLSSSVIEAIGKNHVQLDESYLKGDSPWISYYIYNDENNVVGVFGFFANHKFSDDPENIATICGYWGFWDLINEFKNITYKRLGKFYTLKRYYKEAYDINTDTAQVIKVKSNGVAYTFEEFIADLVLVVTTLVPENNDVFLETVLNEDKDIYIEYNSNEEAIKALNELKANTEAKLNQVIPADMQKQNKEEETDDWKIASTTYEKDEFKLTVVSAHAKFADTSIYQLHFNTSDLDPTRIIFSTLVRDNSLEKQLDFSVINTSENLIAVAELDTFIAKLQESIEKIESNKDIFLEGNLMEEYQYYKNFDSEIQAMMHFEQLAEDYYSKVIKTLSERGLEFEIVDKEYNSSAYSGSIKVININSIEFSINVHRINFGPTHLFSMTYYNSHNNLVFINVNQQYDDVLITNTNKGAKAEVCCPTIESFIETLNKDLDTIANANKDVLLEDREFDSANIRVLNEYREFKEKLVEEIEKNIEENDLVVTPKTDQIGQHAGTFRGNQITVKEYTYYKVKGFKLTLALFSVDDPDDLQDINVASAVFYNSLDGCKYQTTILGKEGYTSIVRFTSKEPNAKMYRTFNELLNKFIAYVKEASNNPDVFLESGPTTLKEAFINLPLSVPNLHEAIDQKAKEVADLIEKYCKITPTIETELSEEIPGFKKIRYAFNANWYSMSNNNDPVVSKDHAGTVIIATTCMSIDVDKNWVGLNLLYLPWKGNVLSAALTSDTVDNIESSGTLNSLYTDEPNNGSNVSFETLLDIITTSFGFANTDDIVL